MLSVSSTQQLPSPLVQAGTCELNPRFKHQAALVGLCFDNRSLEEVNRELQERCFQADCDFYKKGGENPRFQMSFSQAEEFLNDDYSDRPALYPQDKNMGTCILFGGVPATVEKRVHSLAQALENGYTFDRMIATSPDPKGAIAIERLLRPLCSRSSFEEHLLINPQPTVGWTEEALRVIKARDIKGRVTLITDPFFAEKQLALVVSAFGSEQSNGCVSVPMYDWRQEMKLYGYDDAAFGSSEKATIAWAQSAWNFKAREMHYEMKQLDKS